MTDTFHGSKCVEFVGTRPADDQDNVTRDRLASYVRDSGCFYELVPDRFYLVHLAKHCTPWAFRRSLPQGTPFIWSIPYGIFDKELVMKLRYEAFNRDFGPFNLAVTHQFCSKIKIWKDTYDYRSPDKCIVVVLGDDCPKRKLNTTLAVAIAALVLYNKTDKEIIQRLNFSMRFKNPNEKLAKLEFTERKKFSDVSGTVSIMNITLEDCIQAFYAAIQYDFYNYYEFDPGEYFFYETVNSGDLNWIVPGKILAFAGPSSTSSDSNRRYPPRFYYHYFKDHNVTDVIRLNDPEYDSAEFTKIGFQHHDLIFPDGFPPTSTIADNFIKIVDEAKGAVAVHCYAGIGRTGTLIAAYLVARYNFTPQMAIAWTRICRPGSVIGAQQAWLAMKFNAKASPTKATEGRKIRVKRSEQQNIETTEIETPNKTTYIAAEKTFGQAKALLMTKKLRHASDRPNTRSSTTSKIQDNKETTIASQPVCPKADFILDLGKTLPIQIQLGELLKLDGKRNPEFYKVVESGYQWKVKFPQNTYVTLKHEIERDNECNYAIKDQRRCSKSFDPTFEFRYLDEDQPELQDDGQLDPSKMARKIPVVYYSLSQSLSFIRY